MVSSQEQPMDEEFTTGFSEYSTANDMFNDKDERIRKKDKKSANNNLSKLDVDNLIDAESMKTMDGCLQILAQLNVSEALEESE